jgi:hypothetical protein
MFIKRLFFPKPGQSLPIYTSLSPFNEYGKLFFTGKNFDTNPREAISKLHTAIKVQSLKQAIHRRGTRRQKLLECLLTQIVYQG